MLIFFTVLLFFLIWGVTGFCTFIYFKRHPDNISYIPETDDAGDLVLYIFAGAVVLLLHLLIIYTVKPLYKLSETIVEFLEFKNKK